MIDILSPVINDIKDNNHYSVIAWVDNLCKEVFADPIFKIIEAEESKEID